MADLDTLGGDTEAYAINDSGVVVGYSVSNDGKSCAFVKAPGSKMINLLNLDGYNDSYATAINASGQVVGIFSGWGSQRHAFLKTPGSTMVDLGTDGYGSQAYGINDSGQVVGSSETPRRDSYHAFLYAPGSKMVDLGSLDGNGSAALAINRSGQVVGFSVFTDPYSWHAFLKTPGSRMVDLDPTKYSVARAVNSSGQVVGASAGNRAFLYTAVGGKVDLNSLIPANSGWMLMDATGINDSGQIVGSGTINGQTHAFLLTPGLHGVDASDHFDWTSVTTDHYAPQFVIADAWGGHTQFPAQHILRSVPKENEKDVFKAAYCILNFDNSAKVPPAPAWQNGAWQVKQARDAVGDDLIGQLKFMAIDVESVSFGSLNWYQRQQRIAEAIQAVLDIEDGQHVRGFLRPVIYTGSDYWTLITGVSGHLPGSTAFSDFDLWDIDWHSNWKNSHVDKSKWNDTLVGFATDPAPGGPFGGWTKRMGRQYAVAQKDANMTRDNVDLDVFDPSIFNDTYERPPVAEELPVRFFGTSAPNAQVLVNVSGLTRHRDPLNPGKYLLSGTVSLKNIGSQPISGPLQLVFTNLPNAYSLWNASGDRGSGPYLVLPVESGGLGVGQLATTVVSFETSSNGTTRFTFVPRVYSGYW